MYKYGECAGEGNGRGAREKANLNGKFKFQPRFNGTNKITGISLATCS